MKTNQIIALAIAAAAGIASADSVYFQGFDAQGVEYTTSTDGGNFAAVDTNGYSNLSFAVDLAQDLTSNGADDGDILDFVNSEHQVDGGSWMNIFSAINDGVSDFNTLAYVNGVAVTDTFSTFNADLTGVTGSTMALQVVWSLNSGDKDLAIDGLNIFGESIAVVPVPTAAFAGLGMLGLMGASRRFRK